MRTYYILLIGLALSGCRWVDTKEEQKTKELKNMKAPATKESKYIHADDFDSREDNYHWMLIDSKLLVDSSNIEATEIREQIFAENNYADAKLYEYQSVQNKIFNEIESFMEDDNKVFHYPFGDYVYHVSRKKEGDFPTISRYLRDEPSSSKEIINFQKMSEDYAYFKIGNFKISPNNQYIAYSIDTSGNEKYFIQILEVSKKLTQTTSIKNSQRDIIWNNDNKSIFYIDQSKKGSRRSSGVFQYNFMASSNKNNLILKDSKAGINWKIEKSKSGRFIFIYKIDNNTTTTYFIDLQKNRTPILFKEKEPGNSYFLGHQEDHFVIRTNKESSPNFKVYKCKIGAFNDPAKWELLVGHREDALIEKMEVFKDFIVLEEKVDGIKNFHILNSATGMGHYADIKEEETYSAKLKYNFNYFSPSFTYEYSSFSRPLTIYRYSAESRQKESIHESSPKDGFEESKYKTERIWATSFDGVRIPISLIYKNSTKLDGTAPLHIEYEGVFGLTKDLIFKPESFALINRGFIYAIAHTRGGGYLGEKWHSESIQTSKAVGIYDIIYSIEHLINQNYVSKKNVFVSASESNAALVCAALNIKPNLFKGLTLRNPKVDILSSLFNQKTNQKRELKEWGDPQNEKNYFYLKSISPYENIFQAEYPNILIQNDLYNQSSFYWEGLKWAAKLRAFNTGDSWVLIHTDLNQNQTKNSRDKEIELISKEFAFILSKVD